MITEEKAPKYFADFVTEFNGFRKDVYNRFDVIECDIHLLKSRIDSIDSNLKIVIEKQDMHFETIGEMKVQITQINQKLDNKANQFFVDGIDLRLNRLEKEMVV